MTVKRDYISEALRLSGFEGAQEPGAGTGRSSVETVGPASPPPPAGQSTTLGLPTTGATEPGAGTGRSTSTSSTTGPAGGVTTQPPGFQQNPVALNMTSNGGEPGAGTGRKAPEVVEGIEALAKGLGELTVGSEE